MPPLPALCCQRLALRPATSAAPRISAAAKYFGTTRSAPAVSVLPQSPEYLRVPDPPQTVRREPTRNKGHLPVPRKVWNLDKSRVMPGSRRHRRDPRLHEDYVDRIMPRPAPRRAEPSPFDQWKLQVAEGRRVALKEGLSALHGREAKRLGQERRLLRRAARQRVEASKAPERLDEQLTRPTVRAATAVTTAVALDPQRYERAAESAARTAAVLERKREGRRDAVLQLYMAAKDFIVTESEFEARVSQVFTENYFRKISSAGLISPESSQPVQNIWEAKGPPLGIFARLAEDTNKRSSGRTDDGKRLKVVAEELTGGKL